MRAWAALPKVCCPFAASMKSPHTFGQTAEDKLCIFSRCSLGYIHICHNSSCPSDHKGHPHSATFLPAPAQEKTAAQIRVFKGMEQEQAPDCPCNGQLRPKRCQALGTRAGALFLLPFQCLVPWAFTAMRGCKGPQRRTKEDASCKNHRGQGMTWEGGRKTEE